MNRASQRLGEDVYLCVSGDRMVFLDLRQNRYFCLNRQNTQIAIRLFNFIGDGATNGVAPEQTVDPVDGEDCDRVLQALVHKGLIAKGTKGKEALAVRIPLPKTSSSKDGVESSIHLDQLVAFIYASLKASSKLRLYSLNQIVRGMRNRNLRAPRCKRRGPDLSEVVAIFDRLRPYYVRRYVCLYDSLALLEFLAHYQFFPHWVFGVVTTPFNAHCWVQEKECVLNDAVEYVRGFTPILST